MLFRKTAVRLKRNLLGKPARRRLSLQEVAAMERAGVPRDAILDLLDMGYLLPMAGGTTNQNQAMANAEYFPKAIVVTTDQTIHQNDLVYWDNVNYTLKPLSSTTNVTNFAGCAAGTNVPAVYPAPAAGTPSENLPGIQVQRGGSVGLYLQSNDVIDYPFQSVTLAGVDAQTVTKGTATNANRVGVVIVPAPVTPRGASGATPSPETVAGGARIEVWLEPKWPNQNALML